MCSTERISLSAGLRFLCSAHGAHVHCGHQVVQQVVAPKILLKLSRESLLLVFLRWTSPPTLTASRCWVPCLWLSCW